MGLEAESWASRRPQANQSAFMLELDIFRGTRNYLRAADIMAAIPLPQETLSFQFFFRQVAIAPGIWARRGENSADPAATLSLKLPHTTENWAFHTYAHLPARHTENIDETAMLESVRLYADRAICALSDQFTLWDQIVATARAGGQVVFPGSEWILVYVGGNRHALRKSLLNSELELTINRRRGSLVELSFAIDDNPAGQVGIAQR